MRVLLDQNMPQPMLGFLGHHDAAHTYRLGWGELTNGALIEAAERAGFNLLVTGDKRVRYQQNLTSRRLSLMVLSETKWRIIREAIPLIVSAIDGAGEGAYREILLPRPALRRRPPPGPFR